MYCNRKWQLWMHMQKAECVDRKIKSHWLAPRENVNWKDTCRLFEQSKAKQKSRKMSEIPARHLRGESPWYLYEEPPRDGADYITWPVPSNEFCQISISAAIYSCCLVAYNYPRLTWWVLISNEPIVQMKFTGAKMGFVSVASILCVFLRVALRRRHLGTCLCLVLQLRH